MTGFKSGASDDDPLGAGDDRDGAETSIDVDVPGDVDTDSSTTLSAEPSSTGSTSATSLPWLYRRDSITDGRSKTVQLHMQESTVDAQRDAKRDAEDVLGESVNKADLREAALLVGFDRIDEVAAQLREWGYDFD